MSQSIPILRTTLIESLFAAAAFLLKAVSDPVVVEAAPLNQRVAALSAVGKLLKQLDTPSGEVKKPAIDPNAEIVWDYGPEHDALVLGDHEAALSAAAESLDGSPEQYEGVDTQTLDLERLGAAAKYIRARSRVLTETLPENAQALRTAAAALHAIGVIFGKYADNYVPWPPQPASVRK